MASRRQEYTWVEETGVLEMGAPALVYCAVDHNVARETYAKWTFALLAFKLFRDAVTKYLEHQRLGARAIRSSNLPARGTNSVVMVLWLLQSSWMTGWHDDDTPCQED